MNQLTIKQSPFSFLAVQPETQTSAPGCGLAWITNQFHLHGHNYYLYTCYSCPQIQIKKGQKPKEVLNWGGQDV